MSKRINRNRNRKNRKKNNVNQNVNKSLKSNDLEKEEKEIEGKNKIDENSDINETNEMNDILVYESQTNEDEYKEDNNELENRINEILIDEQINSDYDDEKLTDDVVEKSEEEKELEEKVNEVFNENEDDNSVKTDEEVTKKVRNGEVETKKKSKKKTLIIISSLCIILLIVAFLISFAFVNKFNTNVYNNVYLLNENMSGKTQEQIAEFLNLKAEELKNSRKVIVLQNTDTLDEIVPEKIDFTFDNKKIIQDVMSYGRSGNIFVDNFNILKALIFKQNIDVTYTYDETKLDEVIKNIDLSIKDRFVNDSYSVDEKTNKLIIKRGKTGNTIDYEVEKKKIIEALITNDGESKLTLDIIQKKPEEINIDEIYSKVKREPKDAYLDETSNPVKFVEEVVGYDLDVNSLKEVLSNPENMQEEKVIEFNLNVIQPQVKLSDLSYMLYKDKLSGYTTYFPAGRYARSNNLEIALKYLNGKIIMPGETFSYNAAIGDTTTSKGYLPAATFKGGTVVDEIGGGICQTTSTLYNAVLLADLEIVERHQHGLPVGYVPPSRDATVYSPTLDFKFKNNKKYPVKIVTSFSYNGTLNISIYGTKQGDEVEVSLSHKVLSTTPYTTKYIYDSTMAAGTQTIVSEGVNGYTSESYITRTRNGVVISSGLLSKDTYRPQQKIVKVGTKK